MRIGLTGSLGSFLISYPPLENSTTRITIVSGYESQETRAIVLGGRVVVRATIANQDVIQLHGALLKGFFVEKLAIFFAQLLL